MAYPGIAPAFVIGEYDDKPTTTAEKFRSGSSLSEGVSGRVNIDTSYEQDQATLSEVAVPSHRSIK